MFRSSHIQFSACRYPRVWHINSLPKEHPCFSQTLLLSENSWTCSCAILPSGCFFNPFFVSIMTSSRAFQNQNKRLQKMISQQRAVLCADSSSGLGQALPDCMQYIPLNLVEGRRFQVSSVDCTHTLYYIFAVCMSSKLLLILAPDSLIICSI